MEKKLTKKDKVLILEQRSLLEDGIIKLLLFALGYGINGSYIIDQETSQRIKYKNRNLKYSGLNEITPIHYGEMLFNPFRERGLAERLFTIFLEKEQEENGLYVKLYYTTQVKDYIYVEAQIERSKDGMSTLQSDPYKNQTYAYVELILGLSGIVETENLHKLEELYEYDL